MASLEEIQAKFDKCQEFESLKGEEIVAILGIMSDYCKLNLSFESWYDLEDMENIIFGYNELLKELRVPEITREDLNLLYNHTKKNIQKNLRK